MEEHGCTTLIVTGNKVEGPNSDYTWGVLVKNSDTSLGDRETPIHVAAQANVSFEYQNGAGAANHDTFGPVTSYAYTGADSANSIDNLPEPFHSNLVCFGQNETGLTVAYTRVTSGAAMITDGNGYCTETNALQLGATGLVTTMLAFYDDVDDIIADLNDDDTILGQYNRRGAQCVSVIDNTGKGIAIEIAVTKFVYYTVTNDFFAHANVMRMWDDNATNTDASSGTVTGYDSSGNRSQYMVQGLTELMNANYGKLDYRDAVKSLGRYIHNKEEGDQPFTCEISSYWEICKDDETYASMIGVTGDTRYSGKLNCFWAAYGSNPIVGLYLPHIPYAGALPADGAGTWSDASPNNFMYNHVEQVKRPSAKSGGEYIPDNVEDIQTYTDTIEDYTFEQWGGMLKTIAAGLSDAAVGVILNAMIDASQQTAVEAYRSGTDPYIVSYSVNPFTSTGNPGAHMDYDSTLVDGMSIPIKSGDTMKLEFDKTIDIDVADFTLTVTVVGMDNTTPAHECSVTLSPSGGSYESGTTVTLTPACAGAAYQFQCWDGDLTGTDNPGTIVMNEDKNVTCYFEYIIGSDIFGWGETAGIIVDATHPAGGNGLDGTSTDPNENPYLTPYFYHGSAIGDDAIIQIEGVGGVTLQNCIVDDGGAFPWGGTRVDVAIALGGTGNSVKNCTLNNCIRYGITTRGATNWYMGYNTVNEAQYCISGSSGASTNGTIEFNILRGMLNCAIKCKGWDTATIRNNYMDLTPINDYPTKVGVEFSDDTYCRDITVKHNHMTKLSAGAGAGATGIHSDPGPNRDSGGVEISTRNVIQYNVFYNLTRAAWLEGNVAGYTGAPDIDYTMNYNTFVNCIYGVGGPGTNNVTDPNTTA